MENVVLLERKDIGGKDFDGLKDVNYRLCAVRIVDEVSVGWFKRPQYEANTFG